MLLYRILTRLLPRGFRERNAEEMEEIARELTSDPSRVRRTLSRLAACWDVCSMAVRLRLGMPGADVPVDPFAPGRPDGRLKSLASDLLRGLALSLRSLRSRPGFAVITILVLALGIGSATTIFSVVNGVLLRPLPYLDSNRIGTLWHHFGIGAQSGPLVNPQDVWDYRAWSERFEAFTYGSGADRLLHVGDDARITLMARVEGGFFEFFGYEPILGRSIQREDDLPESPLVAVLSHRLWMGAFGGDSEVVGTTVDLAGQPHQIVGVMPPDFQLQLPAEAFFLKDAEIWVAARVPPDYRGTRIYTVHTAFGRIKPDVTFEQAQEELDEMVARTRSLEPELETAQLWAEIVPLNEDTVKHARPYLVLLLYAVGLILLVSCANAANLLLVRGHARAWEISIRNALGASRRRLFLLVLTESAVLAAAGGALGVALGAVGLEAVRILGRESLPRLDTVSFEWRVLLFALGLSVAAALISGMIPAVRASRGRPADVLGGSRRGSGSRSRTRIQNGLVLAEVAMSFVLLVGTGLLVRSFSALQRVDPGFSTEDVMTLRVSLPRDAYPGGRSRWDFYQEMAQRIETFPEVSSVAAVTQLPLTGSGYQAPYAYDEVTATNWESTSADVRWTTPGFFRTIGAEIVAGTDFTPEELESGESIVIIGDGLAAQAFPDGPAVGQFLQTSSNEVSEQNRYSRVVGVVSHLHLHDLTRPWLKQIFAPMRFGGEFTGRDHFSVLVRIESPAADLAERIRGVVEGMGQGIAVQDFRPIEALVGRAMGSQRVSMVLMTLFGLTSLLLASIGLYGVLSFAVGSRTKEIGVRVALGQRTASIHWLVIRQGMGLVLLSILVGGVVSLGMAGVVGSLLYEVEPVDPATYLGVAFVLSGCGFLACWRPARRATRIEPVEALRVE